MQYILKALRIREWWNYKIQFLFGLAYLIIGLDKIPFEHALAVIPVLLVWAFAVFGFGFFLNDVYDIKQDLIAGKLNFSNKFSKRSKAIIIAVLITLAIAPWLFIPFNYLAFSLVIIHLVLAIAYSMPPIRFKEKTWIGIVIGASIETFIPFLIVLFSLSPSVTFKGLFSFNVYILISFWCMLFGIRNILLHQIQDHENDTLSGVNSFAVIYGPQRSFLLLNFIIAPFEIICFGLINIMCAINNSYYFITPALLLLVVIMISGINKFNPPFLSIIKYAYKKQSNLTYLMINAIYEGILPYVCLVYLISISKYYFIFLCLHAVLFPLFIKNIFAKSLVLFSLLFTKTITRK